MSRWMSPEVLPISGRRARWCRVGQPAGAAFQSLGQSVRAIIDELYQCLAGFALVVRECQRPEPLELSRRPRGPDRIEEKAVSGLFGWQAHGAASLRQRVCQCTRRTTADVGDPVRRLRRHSEVDWSHSRERG
jgi:hypothetical protein